MWSAPEVKESVNVVSTWEVRESVNVVNTQL
jgi:hypothetical protein